MTVDREQIEREARILRQQGSSWRAVGRALGIDYRRAQRLLDSSAAKLHTEQAVRWKRKNKDSARSYSKKWDENNVERRLWRSMIIRCTHPQSPSYRWYGARGISVCDRWLESFDAFLADVGRRPSPDLSIDRIDNDGDYEPGNVRWATRSEQQRNKRNSRRAA